MPRYYFEDDIVVVESGAHFSTDDLQETVQRATEDRQFKSGTKLLLDVRESLENAPRQEISRRVRLLAESDLAARCAVVVSRSVHYGLARMSQALGEGSGTEIRAFQDDIEEAKAWLRDGG